MALDSGYFEVSRPVMTNADRIRAMSDEELARDLVFFCPSDAVFRGEDTYGKPHYTGLGGKYYSTSEEVIDANLKWLKQSAEKGDAHGNQHQNDQRRKV